MREDVAAVVVVGFCYCCRFVCVCVRARALFWSKKLGKESNARLSKNENVAESLFVQSSLEVGEASQTAKYGGDRISMAPMTLILFAPKNGNLNRNLANASRPLEQHQRAMVLHLYSSPRGPGNKN